MSEKRLNQVNQLIQREIADIILKEIDFPPGCLVTVTRVKTSVDIAFARVCLSVLPVSFAGRVLKILEKNIYHLQQVLNKRLVMRTVPKIMFRLDLAEQEVERVNKLLDKIKNQG
ncbi:MAG: 30S ribosome-binding factor RbfA [Patescibacteria group bacterium]